MAGCRGAMAAAAGQAALLRPGQDVLLRTGEPGMQPLAPGRIKAINDDGTLRVTFHGWSDANDDDACARERVVAGEPGLCARLCAEIRRIERSGAWPWPATGYVRHAVARCDHICGVCAQYVARVTERAIMRLKEDDHHVKVMFFVEHVGLGARYKAPCCDDWVDASKVQTSSLLASADAGLGIVLGPVPSSTCAARIIHCRLICEKHFVLV